MEVVQILLLIYYIVLLVLVILDVPISQKVINVSLLVLAVWILVSSSTLVSGFLHLSH